MAEQESPGDGCLGCVLLVCFLMGPPGWILGVFALIGMVLNPPKGTR